MSRRSPSGSTVRCRDGDPGCCCGRPTVAASSANSSVACFSRAHPGALLHLEKDLGPMALPRIPVSPQPFTVASTSPPPASLPSTTRAGQHAVASPTSLRCRAIVPAAGCADLAWLSPDEAGDPGILADEATGAAASGAGAPGAPVRPPGRHVVAGGFSPRGQVALRWARSLPAAGHLRVGPPPGGDVRGRRASEAGPSGKRVAQRGLRGVGSSIPERAGPPPGGSSVRGQAGSPSRGGGPPEAGSPGGAFGQSSPCAPAHTACLARGPDSRPEDGLRLPEGS